MPERELHHNLRRARAQVRGHGAPRRGPHARLLERVRVRDRRRRALPPPSSARLPSTPPSTASGSRTRRWPGVATCATTTHAWRIVRGADHPSLGTCLDSFHILSRGSRPGADPRRSPARRSSTSSSPTRRTSSWTSCSGAGTTAASPARAGSTSRRSSGTSSRPGTPDRSRSRSSTMCSARPTRGAWRSTRCARCCVPRGGRRHHGAAARDAAARVRLHRARRRRGRGCARRAPLIAMGFRHAGQHRSKPVQLWRHGDTRILVNHGDADGSGPRVAAIALESADPMRSAERAQRLLAPLLPRDRGPGEADLSAVAAPDGTAVFFCRSQTAGAGGWLSDFLTAGPPGGGVSADVAGIDHVALSQPFDFFDEAALFYRSVLGLELQQRRRARHARRACSQPRRARRRTATSGSRSACRWSATTASRSSTSRSRATTCSPRRRRCASAACRCSRSRTTTTTTSCRGRV